MNNNNSRTNTIITVDLQGHPRNTPLGIILAPAAQIGSDPDLGNGNDHGDTALPERSRVVLVAGWSRGQKLGPIQKMSNVRIGDQLVEINNVNIKGTLTFRQVMDLLKTMIYGTEDSASISSTGLKREKAGGVNTRLKSLGFEPNPSRLLQQRRHESLNDTSGMTSSSSPLSWNIMKNGQLYAFQSSIQRVRRRQVETMQEEGNRRRVDVDEFVEYEIDCRLLVRHIASGKRLNRIVKDGEIECSWSVWKRYSDFKFLHSKLQDNYAWQMNSINGGRGIDLPKTHVLYIILFGNLNESFAKRRRKEFQQYWSALQQCDDLFDFTDPTSHRFSRDIAGFLDIEGHFPRSPILQKKHRQDQATPSSKMNEESCVNTSMELDQSSISQLSQSFASLSGHNSQHAKMKSQEPSEAANKDASLRLESSLAGIGDESKNDGIREIMVPTKHGNSTPKSSRKQRRNMKRAKPAFQRIGLDFS